MPSCSSAAATTTANTANLGVDTAVEAISNIHLDIIQAHILTKLDGQTLASTSCTSSKLNTLCYEEKLWKNICNSSWPSTTDPLVHDTISTFPSGHRSFFSDAFSTVNHQSRGCSDQDRSSKISKLISAVDIHFGNKLICSRVIVTETKTSWFSCFPFRLDLLEPKEIVSTPVTLEGGDGIGDGDGDGNGDENTCMARVEKSMRLSWILIDPDTKRALNVSSINPVAVQRHWSTGEFLARFELVVPGGGGGGGLVQCGVVATYKVNKEIQVKEVSMLRWRTRMV